MSASMASQDVAPSRATRALQKVTDIVRSRTDGVTGLVVYSGEAHTVTPLTDDTRTIETLLPALSPFIMPAPGSRPEKAVKLGDRKSTRLNSSHVRISYAVFCLKKKNKTEL